MAVLHALLQGDVDACSTEPADALVGTASSGENRFLVLYHLIGAESLTAGILAGTLGSPNLIGRIPV